MHINLSTGSVYSNSPSLSDEDDDEIGESDSIAKSVFFAAAIFLVYAKNIAFNLCLLI